MTTTKSDFSEEEWESLIAAPWIAGALIIGVDFHLLGSPGEITAMAESAGSSEATGEARSLVTEMIADMNPQTGDDDSHERDDEEWHAELLMLLSNVASIVDRACTVGEADGYKRWVLNTANATAEASTEGRFLGIGCERVSDKERAALDEIETALKL